jgi:hypothetical protein
VHLFNFDFSVRHKSNNTSSSEDPNNIASAVRQPKEQVYCICSFNNWFDIKKYFYVLLSEHEKHWSVSVHAVLFL